MNTLNKIAEQLDSNNGDKFLFMWVNEDGNVQWKTTEDNSVAMYSMFIAMGKSVPGFRQMVNDLNKQFKKIN